MSGEQDKAAADTRLLLALRDLYVDSLCELRGRVLRSMVRRLATRFLPDDMKAQAEANAEDWKRKNEKKFRHNTKPILHGGFINPNYVPRGAQ